MSIFVPATQRNARPWVQILISIWELSFSAGCQWGLPSLIVIKSKPIWVGFAEKYSLPDSERKNSGLVLRFSGVL